MTNVWSTAGVLCSASCPARPGRGQAASHQAAAVQGFTASLCWGFGLLYGRDVGSGWGRAAETAAVVCCRLMCCIDHRPRWRRAAERAEFAVSFVLSAEPRARGQKGGVRLSVQISLQGGQSLGSTAVQLGISLNKEPILGRSGSC